MTNVEYIFLFAEKHNFPRMECEVVFNSVDGGNDIYTNDDDIISVKFDKSVVENEIKIEDIRFDIDSDFPEDVFSMWQKDDPNISFRSWISLGKYVPVIIQNTEFFDELDSLTKQIEMGLETLFSQLGGEDSDYEDSDYDDEDDDDDDDEDSDYDEDDECYDDHRKQCSAGRRHTLSDRYVIVIKRERK